ncbi:hypothetical protein TWF506_003041 [Arthrobotrys conoides]|uniref:ribonuclease H n=1 Tax=Arthrobotrys conoides TaxID=74498 RepID=A0AAN8NMN5_9PEZI
MDPIPYYMSSNVDLEEYGRSRLFHPYINDTYRQIFRENSKELVISNEEKGIRQLQFIPAGRSNPVLQRNTMIVNIDGACRNNGGENPHGAYGVYFGPNSPYNASGLITSDVAQTSNRAEIEALIKALDIIQIIANKDMSLSDLIVLTDSEYLVKAITEWVYIWEGREGMTSKGTLAVHFHLLKRVRDRLDWMEYSDDGGIQCRFWLIDRNQNVEADKLANLALDQATMP